MKEYSVAETQGYIRFAAAIIARAAVDYIRPERPFLRESAIKFFESELFAFLAMALGIEPWEFIVNLNARRGEYYNRECNPNGMGVKAWLRERAK